MKETGTTLVLGGIPRSAVPIARSLARRGIPVVAAGFSGVAVPLRSNALRREVILPHPSWPDFNDAFLDLLECERIDLILPCSDLALVAIGERYEAVRARANPGCPAPEIVRLVLDKELTLEAARRLGIDQPQTYHLPNIETFDARLSDIRFPIITKPATHAARAQGGVAYFEDGASLRALFLERERFGENNLIQEYCLGTGVGISLIVEKGEPIVVFAHRRIRETPFSGGVSVVMESIAPDPDLVRAATALLRELTWEGPAMVEFRVDEGSGRAVLMEVNGRYWGSIALPIAVGADVPYVHWQLAHGIDPGAQRPYAQGYRVRWLLGDTLRLVGVLRRTPRDALAYPSPWGESVRYVADFRPSVHPVLFSRSDPLPAFVEWATTARSLAKVVGSRLVGLERMRALAEAGSLGPLGFALQAQMRARDRTVPDAPARVLRERDVHRVLFVCSGNIMRSPFAAEVATGWAARKGRALDVSSAGLHAKEGVPAHAWAREAARELGFSLDGHRAHRVSALDVERADIVVSMDAANRLQLMARFPNAANKVVPLGFFTEGGSVATEISDPYGTSAVETLESMRTIEAAVVKLLESARVPAAA